MTSTTSSIAGSKLTSVSSAYMKTLYDSMLLCGAPQEGLAQLVPGGEGALDNPSARFPTDVARAILKYTSDTTGEPGIGLRAGLRARTSSLQEVGYALTFAADLREVMALNSQYQPLIQQFGRTTVVEQGPLARIVWSTVSPDVEADRFLTEAMMAGYATIGRWLMWDQEQPLHAMRFRHRKPKRQETLDLYKTVFDCPVHFEAEDNAMEIEVDLLNCTLPTANAGLLGVLKRRLDARMKELTEPRSFQREVSNCLHAQLLSGDVSQEETAKRLGIGARTLRRQLSEEGVSFNELLDQARRDSCEIYIRQHILTLTEISGLLGYSDQPGFARAFRRWHGKSPGEFRKQIGLA